MAIRKDIDVDPRDVLKESIEEITRFEVFAADDFEKQRNLTRKELKEDPDSFIEKIAKIEDISDEDNIKHKITLLWRSYDPDEDDDDEDGEFLDENDEVYRYYCDYYSCWYDDFEKVCRDASTDYIKFEDGSYYTFDFTYPLVEVYNDYTIISSTIYYEEFPPYGDDFGDDD